VVLRSFYIGCGIVFLLRLVELRRLRMPLTAILRKTPTEPPLHWLFYVLPGTCGAIFVFAAVLLIRLMGFALFFVGEDPLLSFALPLSLLTSHPSTPPFTPVGLALLLVTPHVPSCGCVVVVAVAVATSMVTSVFVDHFGPLGGRRLPANRWSVVGISCTVSGTVMFSAPAIVNNKGSSSGTVVAYCCLAVIPGWCRLAPSFVHTVQQCRGSTANLIPSISLAPTLSQSLLA
jgi:uncharacterized membrane protein YdcZ (DUF606 family)